MSEGLRFNPEQEYTPEQIERIKFLLPFYKGTEKFRVGLYHEMKPPN